MQYYSPREAVFVTKTVKNMVIAALMLQKELQQKVSFRNYQMWTCAKIPVGFAESVDHIYIKGKCPQTWSDTYIKSKCEMDLQIQVDYMQQIPVLGKRTNITYTNVYCAICNNDDEIHQWNVTVSCEGGISEKALKNSNFLSITNYDSASKSHNIRDLSIHFNSMSNVAFNIVRIDTKVEKSTWKKPHEFVSIVTLGTVYIYIWNK
ncbi:hypothetical protein GQR58_017573 [Nymphon striatum]|nr:hypothetical protein GQR58_017573 [Nymphon striatum]